MTRIVATAVIAAMYVSPLCAAEPGCGQQLVDGTAPPATTATISPRQPVQPFYQWESNNGYCGEASMLQAGLANGQYMSQFNARLICGTGLSQSGVAGACAAHGGTPNYNAQLLIEDPGTGVSGPHVYADAALCVANSRLTETDFPYTGQAVGLAGYEQYMSWVKREVILGHQVTLGVLINGGGDAQYDHEVAVLLIGTNHAPTDPTYYADDVLYFDDHGAYTLRGSQLWNYPAIPPGAGHDTAGCTPYVYGYSFGSLPQTRAGANKNSAQAYSVIIPGNQLIRTGAGGNGYDSVPILGPHNYAFSVSGPADSAGQTLPVALVIQGPTRTRGKANPPDPVAGYNYENPMIGKSVNGIGCTNQAPLPWMTHLTLQATASGLQPGTQYNLYEYDFASVQGTGSSAALGVPTAAFNAQAGLASHVTRFTAIGTSFSVSVVKQSDQIVVFRCVPANGP